MKKVMILIVSTMLFVGCLSPQPKEYTPEQMLPWYNHFLSEAESKFGEHSKINFDSKRVDDRFLNSIYDDVEYNIIKNRYNILQNKDLYCFNKYFTDSSTLECKRSYLIGDGTLILSIGTDQSDVSYGSKSINFVFFRIDKLPNSNCKFKDFRQALNSRTINNSCREDIKTYFDYYIENQQNYANGAEKKNYQIFLKQQTEKKRRDREFWGNVNSAVNEAGNDIGKTMRDIDRRTAEIATNSHIEKDFDDMTPYEKEEYMRRHPISVSSNEEENKNSTTPHEYCYTTTPGLILNRKNKYNIGDKYKGRNGTYNRKIVAKVRTSDSSGLESESLVIQLKAKNVNTNGSCLGYFESKEEAIRGITSQLDRDYKIFR